MRTAPASCLALLCACASAESYAPLAPAPATTGPRVLFDLAQKPLPEIPFPSDLATRPDPSSPTGVRVNASLVAPTRLETRIRTKLDRLDGFGTFAPISVAFDADLDVLDLYARQRDADPSNDAVYLLDLETGAPQPLDFMTGRFPVALRRPDNYFLNDPMSAVPNLLFAADNLLHAPDPDWASKHGGVPQGIDDLLTFYERATRTLLLRPQVPLKQQHRYAVLLTRRLVGTSGAPVGGPKGFAGIAHAAQASALKRLPDLLPAGLKLSEVAFAWSFTTQSVTRDLEAIRAGLYGQGPLGWLAAKYPLRTEGMSTMKLLPSLDKGANVHLISVDKMLEVLSDPLFLEQLDIEFDSDEAKALFDSFKYVSHFVTGTFVTPDFLEDPTQPVNDSAFEMDRDRGTARTTPGTVTFFLSVPKQVAGRKAPFPVAIYGHGYTSAHFEGVFGFGGTMAKFGIATVAIDAYGHGIGLEPVTIALIKALLAKYEVAAFADALVSGRARDLDNDGTPDSGGDFWTADSFHTRDVVRQTMVDWMQLIRLFKTFDGATQMKLPDGSSRLAGDFDGDGVPDVGGPEGDVFAFGISLGGILASIIPAIEPSVVAAAPIAGGGGYTDIGVRTTQGGVVQAVFLELLGPMVATCSYSLIDKRCGGKDAEPMLVFDIQKTNSEARIPIARANLKPGDSVTVCNGANGECYRGAADEQGRLRLPIAADGPWFRSNKNDAGAVTGEVLRPGDALTITIESAGAQRKIETFEVDTAFMGAKFAAGSKLMALARGYGKSRNTPDFRRLQGLSQLILEPGDPINYAAHYLDDLLPARSAPANVLVIGTVGDNNVPINTAIATARAAGILDPRPLPAFGLSAEDVLIRGGVLEGLSRLRRFASSDAGPRALLSGHVRCDDGSRCGDEILLDATGYSCDESGKGCQDAYGAPRLDPPLRTELSRATSAGVSALFLPYLNPRGQHGFQNPQPHKAFDMDTFSANVIGRYFQTRGREVRFERCQAKIADCPWIPPVP